MIRSTVRAGVSRLRHAASRLRERVRPAPEPPPPAARPPETRSAPPGPPRPAAPPPGAAAGGVEPPTEDAVRRVLEEMVRPALQADGGDIELLGVAGGEVRVRLHGACQGCPGADVTLQMGVEALLREELPGITRVVAVP